jgi:epoxyqueuosine reductase
MARRMAIRDFPLSYELIGAESLGAMDEAWTRRLASPEVTGNEVFRSYIGSARVRRPESMEWAGALVISALFVPGRIIEFDSADGPVRIVQPPNYYGGTVKREEVRAAIARDLGARVEPTDLMPLKTLAAWSGLGRYGRNNIIYVEGMGTSLVLRSFWTETPPGGLPAPPGPAFLERCDTCSLCVRSCPTAAIPPAFGCIDAGRCLSLYNEIEGEFPAWIPTDSHNALIGCTRCQMDCPENSAFKEGLAKGESFDREELGMILAGKAGPASDAALARLIADDDPESLAANRPVMGRNLRAFMEARRLGVT